MDKLKTKRLNLEGLAFLSREQLKKVVGGSFIDTTTTKCPEGMGACYCQPQGFIGCFADAQDCLDACNSLNPPS